MSVPYVYDTGVLIAMENNDRRVWLRHHLALEQGRVIHVPAVVVSQAWRDPRRQVRLSRALSSCHVVPIDVNTAKAVGVLCGQAGVSDVVDATVVVVATALHAMIWTSDPDDINRLVFAAGITPSPVVNVVS